MKVDEFVGVNRIDQGQGGNLMVHGWPVEQCVVSDHDRAILRELGARLRELAERPYEQEKKALWTAHNDLQTGSSRSSLSTARTAETRSSWWHEAIKCEGDGGRLGDGCARRSTGLRS